MKGSLKKDKNKQKDFINIAFISQIEIIFFFLIGSVMSKDSIYKSSNFFNLNLNFKSIPISFTSSIFTQGNRLATSLNSYSDRLF